MALINQANLLANATFRSRVKIAMLTTARTVLNQATPNSGQLAAAQRIIDNPDAALDKTMAALIADANIATAAAADDTGVAITDVVLQTAVTSALGALVR